MGGTGADTITTGSSTNFVFGDDGYISWVGSELNPDNLIWAGANSDPGNIDLVASTTPADGGNDQITIGAGKAIVVGGKGDDTITGGNGTNVILGDSGAIFSASPTRTGSATCRSRSGMVETTAPGIGGNDTITVGTGSAIVMGGTGADSITHRLARRASSSATTATSAGSARSSTRTTSRGPAPTTTRPNIDVVSSTTPSDGGNDHITIGPARRSWSAARATTRSRAAPARTSSSATAARSSPPPPTRTASATLPMTIGWSRRPRPASAATTRSRRSTGNAIVMGGTGADSITTGASTNFVFGDDGYISWVGAELNPDNLSWAGADSDPVDIDLVASTTPADGGTDHITIGAGKAIVVGGRATTRSPAAPAPT